MTEKNSPVKIQKKLFTKELPCSAKSRMPRKFFIEVMTKK